VIKYSAGDYYQEQLVMWMTREEIAEALGIVPNSVRGKVQKGQIERKVEAGKNYYRAVDPELSKKARPAQPPTPVEPV
jgi:hypothetical protein